MNLKETLAALQKAGTAQNRKVYARHGVQGEMFGVSYAELGKLKKKIGVDHELALGLWADGNHDARILATMVADPARLKSRELDAMARQAHGYVQCGALAGLIGKSPLAVKKFEAWKNRKNEWVAATAWDLLSDVATNHPDTLEEAFCAAQIDLIAAEIHDRPNRVRHSMNMALIATGVLSDRLHCRAVAAARKIGKVEVDHGETGCKTPDAIPYMEKMMARRRGKSPRAGKSRR